MGLISNSVLIRILRWLERTAYTMANHIVILAPGMGTTLNALGVADAKVTLIPNGCDLELFRPTRRAPPSALPGIAATDITAVFTGAHGLANGLTQLIEVAARMSKLNSHLKFVFIGSGSQKPLLVQQATRAGLGNCLFFPPMPKSQLAELLPSFDIGLVFLAPVSAFYYGTSPNKFFDYLSAGIPIVVNHPGWVADLVTASHCGFSAPPSDTDAVVQSLLTLAENPELRHSMGRNARLLGEERFDRLELCKQFVNTIEDTYRLSLGATQ
jgi:glycosyltransferase involved in cell wall biosynthesis